MASVHEYLKKLLYQYDCVVVPEFGAFLTHYQPAAFTETTGFFLPPRKRVAFNEALHFDDGILANYIMLHEPVMREGAQRHITLFVDELREQVEVTGRFELDGIGTFSRNEEGKLQFDPSLRHNFYGEAYGMMPLSVQAVNRLLVVETPVEAVPVTTLGPVLVRDQDVTLTPLRSARPYWQAAAAVLLIGSLGVVSYFSVIKPGQPLQSSLDPANLFRVPAATATHSTEANATLKKVEVSRKLAPVPVLIARPTITPAPERSVEIVPAPILEATKAKIETLTLTKPEPVKPAAPIAVIPARTGPHYTIIAGVFSRKESAMPLVRYLHQSGYPDAYILVQGRRGLRYKVAAFGSDDKLKAQSETPAISKMIGSTAWIFTN